MSQSDPLTGPLSVAPSFSWGYPAAGCRPNCFNRFPRRAALGRLTDWGVEAVVVHIGAQGAGYYADGCLVQGPPTPAANLVNSTGTGDVLSICMILLAPRTNLEIGEKLALANRVVAAFMAGNLQLIPRLQFPLSVPASRAEVEQQSGL